MNGSRRWTAYEDKYLASLWGKTPKDEVAAAMGRTIAAISIRAARLKLSPKSNTGGGRVQQTHCKRGHALTPDNIYTYGGSRQCRECNLLWGAKKRAADRAAKEQA